MEKQYIYGESLTKETVKMQEEKPEDFKQMSEVAKELEQLANKGDENDTQKFYTILMDSQHKQYLSFSLFKSLKHALKRKNLKWTQFLLESIGIDLNQEQFKNLLHLFITQSALKERQAYQEGQNYEDIDIDLQILELFLKNKQSDQLLAEKEQSYGNTPLHISCSLHSTSITKRLLQANCDKQATNNEGKTPIQVVESEITKYKNHVNTTEKERTLQRLQELKQLLENQ